MAGNAYLLVGETLTLVDTGMPGNASRVLDLVRDLGRSSDDVTRIVLTAGSNHGGPYVALSETHFAKPSDEPREGEICVVTDRSTAKWHVPQDEKDEAGLPWLRDRTLV